MLGRSPLLLGAESCLQSRLRGNLASLPYTKQPTTAPNQPSAPNPGHSTVEAMDVESPPLPTTSTILILNRREQFQFAALYSNILLPSCLSLSSHEQKHYVILGEFFMEKVQHHADKPCALSPLAFN
jgi:hypothetical protein